jgi:hypothetical protein
MSVFVAIRRTEAETSNVVAATSSVVAETSSVVADYPRQLGEAEVQRRARLANMSIACQNLMARTE